MNFINTRKFLAILTMMIAITAVPNTASARGSLHIELPHLSLGFHGGHHNKYRKRHYNNHRNYNNYYSNNNSYYGSGYKSYQHYQPQPRYYQPSYQNQNGYCPTPGYSSTYYNGGGCYEHGDHYHCDQ